MTLKAHRFVGLNRDVWLPDDIEVIIDIVPDWRTNIRSNQAFTAQAYSTFHETANFNQGANAWAERNWLHSGAGGSYVGYNFAVDDIRIIQLTPLDEVTWAAGQAWWNQHAWAVEQCVGGGVDIPQARRNATMLHAGLLTTKEVDIADGLIPHQRVYGKWCPKVILDNGLWPSVMKNATAQQAAIRAMLAGDDAGDAADDALDGWPYPDPVTPWFWDELMDEHLPYVTLDNGEVWVRSNTLYEVKSDTERLQYAVKDGSRVVGPPLKAGTQFRGAAAGITSKRDGFTITEMFTRVSLDDLTVVVDE